MKIYVHYEEREPNFTLLVRLPLVDDGDGSSDSTATCYPTRLLRVRNHQSNHQSNPIIMDSDYWCLRHRDSRAPTTTETRSM